MTPPLTKVIIFAVTEAEMRLVAPRWITFVSWGA